ncbi:MAG: hypothetical protein H0V12_11290 [Chloroflexi bacterium]|nr:hypothetical protein [Chloroflexota bacterium]
MGGPGERAAAHWSVLPTSATGCASGSVELRTLPPSFAVDSAAALARVQAALLNDPLLELGDVRQIMAFYLKVRSSDRS